MAIALLLGLAACGGSDRLHRFGQRGAAPDDFSVLPSHPLVIPATLDLPVPTPGGANLADPDPSGAAMAILGGQEGGGMAGDGALMARVGRYGADPAIRSTLRDEDAALRRRAAALGGLNIMGRDRYFQSYAGMALDPWAELARFRAAGIATPSAPPRP
ncbi:MAG: DUF3035 domain-containing protein [Rubellimicrobium sp.]|nr:DUF3035 domain-containing protein [Rubellimicrobium sp.]